MEKFLKLQDTPRTQVNTLLCLHEVFGSRVITGGLDVFAAGVAGQRAGEERRDRSWRRHHDAPEADRRSGSRRSLIW